MTRRWVLGVLVGAAVLAGCADERTETSAVAPTVTETAVADAAASEALTAADAAGGSVAPAPRAPAPQGVGQQVVPAAPKVVRNGEVQLEVAKDGVRAAFDRATAITTARGGFVADSSLSTTAEAPGGRSGRLVLRVPEPQLDEVLAELGPLGKVLSTQLKGEDVTGQIVDLAARTKTLEAEEATLRTLLGRAGNVGEVLQVQQHLFDVRQQIEQLRAQQEHLRDASAYATLTVGLREPIPGATKVEPPKDRNVFQRSWDLARENTGAVVSAVVLTVGATTPVWVPGLLIGAVAWSVARRRRASAPPPAPSVP